MKCYFLFCAEDEAYFGGNCAVLEIYAFPTRELAKASQSYTGVIIECELEEVINGGGNPSVGDFKLKTSKETKEWIEQFYNELRVINCKTELKNLRLQVNSKTFKKEHKTKLYKESCDFTLQRLENLERMEKNNWKDAN